MYWRTDEWCTLLVQCNSNIKDVNPVRDNGKPLNRDVLKSLKSCNNDFKLLFFF